HSIPLYSALSYAWGPPNPSKQILLNGKVFTVRANLWHFLEMAQRDILKDGLAGRVLWIDQLCIDQSAKGEKNHQVAMMSEIYEKALTTFIWLGPGSKESDRAMQGIRNQAQNQGLVVDLAGWRQIGALFARPYWSRIWIVQEIMLS
ncbi:heterokaryon incompatibility, partial [Tothia fuscella]